MNFLLNRRITICMLFIALSLLGYVSYKQLPVELLPNAELPVLFIQVSSQHECPDITPDDNLLLRWLFC